MRKVKDAVDLTTNEKIYFKGHAKATYLSDGRNVEDALGEIPSAESSVFEAMYGTTTFAEIVEALESGKVIICRNGAWIARATRWQSTQVQFQAESHPNITRLTCNDRNEWLTATYNATHELKDSSDGIIELTIANKTAEVATPQYVQSLIVSTLNTEV